MASVIQLARYRSVARRDLPLDIPVGDADLRAVALLLWVGSVCRVTLALLHQQAFEAEATLALFCVVLLPFLIVPSRRSRDTVRQ